MYINVIHCQTLNTEQQNYKLTTIKIKNYPFSVIADTACATNQHIIPSFRTTIKVSHKIFSIGFVALYNSELRE